MIHETLVELLMMQQATHRGVFAVMDSTFAGDGPGPPCMVLLVNHMILASADHVAIRRRSRMADGLRSARDPSGSPPTSVWGAATRARSTS